MLAIAARLLGLNTPASCACERGRVERLLGGAWTDDRARLADIAQVAYLDPLRLPAGMEPGLEVHKAYDPPPMTYSNATHLCEVVVDIAHRRSHAASATSWSRTAARCSTR